MNDELRSSILNAITRSLNSIRKYKSQVTVRRTPVDRVKVTSLSEFLECRINYEMFKIPELLEISELYEGSLWKVELEGENFRSFDKCLITINQFRDTGGIITDLLNDLVIDLDGDCIEIVNSKPLVIDIKYTSHN